MLITTEQLSGFNGSYPEDTTLQTIYINTAHGVIMSYIGYDPENVEQWKKDEVFKSTVQFVCLEIASLMEQEEGQNIGINSKSFGESGTRSFLNVVDYSKYLKRLDSYRSKAALSL